MDKMGASQFATATTEQGVTFVDKLLGTLRKSGSETYRTLAALVQTGVGRLLEKKPQPCPSVAVCAGMVQIWTEYPETRIANESEQMAVILEWCLGLQIRPDGPGRYLEEDVHHAETVASAFSFLWYQDVTGTKTMQCLQVIMLALANGTGLPPSPALASVMRRVPPQLVAVSTKRSAQLQGVSDEDVLRALRRIIKWLTWPGPSGMTSPA